ncbi:MAG: PEP/pyruvate-binding domain-containing protein [Verrucomicrobiae bacterium]|nr:PEP/pyruvate-binding domain-containing protein [Verrucomicrobiae bacterium]
MSAEKAVRSSGLPGLDRVLQGLRAGDNVVWLVDDVGEYQPLVAPLLAEAGRQRQPLTYFRFARHAPVLDNTGSVHVCRLDPQDGFERFVTCILDVIERNGPGAFYVFDCLSDLAADWFSDRMLGNFFMIVCPYLYELDTIAYFALEKHVHSVHATGAIFNTAQVIIEVYRHGQRIFVHPKKVWQRRSPTMYTLHSWDGYQFTPVTSSATITDILSGVPHPWTEFTIHRPGIWVRTFQQAQHVLQEIRNGRASPESVAPLFEQLMKMVATRDRRFQELARRYLKLSDLVEIMQRMVGTGLIGGKSLGMLLGRAILRETAPKWTELLESHDSFYIGSDVFYTYLVQNGCWWLRRRQKDFKTQLERAAEAREKILNGQFPPGIESQFMEMLDYFGQSPLIVRSSSLLEDNYGNAFSGKYESVFLANQGTPQERLQAFTQAVRLVYASTMSEEALQYRLHHGLLDSDEQMALLVQRVSGEQHGELFFPQIAGVGFSFNPFVWSEDIDPHAGVLRLVFGLGTRAVERVDDDYTRLVALNAPLKRAEARPDDTRRYTQRCADVLDLAANRLATRDFASLAAQMPRQTLNWFANLEEAILPHERFLTFEGLISKTNFVPLMRELCQTLEQAYNHPVDIEFTAQVGDDGSVRINLLQCRPFQVKIVGKGSPLQPPGKIPADRLLFESSGPIVGSSLAMTIDRLIYVVPTAYSKLSMSQRYSVARTIGQLTHLPAEGATPKIMLLGPGRWGTSMPSLGVPVSFAEINTARVICELAVMHAGLVPEVSLGTHFFNDLVETDMLYLAVVPQREGHAFHEELLHQRPNQLLQMLPSAAGLADVLWVVDFARVQPSETLALHVDSMKQKAFCYWETPSS